eukprot:TRINITY_DN49558_c0_g1_i2.p1 TRINITY_DN49558_c0_g1~~TRINITY_DN49558_c0_g1_i2.p1  ORF type:complete len:874 (-),score=141.50 TRINITY_DN49558_c0_g1_i2:67-2688(-)
MSAACSCSKSLARTLGHRLGDFADLLVTLRSECDSIRDLLHESIDSNSTAKLRTCGNNGACGDQVAHAPTGFEILTVKPQFIVDGVVEHNGSPWRPPPQTSSLPLMPLVTGIGATVGLQAEAVDDGAAGNGTSRRLHNGIRAASCIVGTENLIPPRSMRDHYASFVEDGFASGTMGFDCVKTGGDGNGTQDAAALDRDCSLAFGKGPSSDLPELKASLKTDLSLQDIEGGMVHSHSQSAGRKMSHIASSEESSEAGADDDRSNHLIRSGTWLDGRFSRLSGDQNFVALLEVAEVAPDWFLRLLPSQGEGEGRSMPRNRSSGRINASHAAAMSWRCQACVPGVVLSEAQAQVIITTIVAAFRESKTKKAGEVAVQPVSSVAKRTFATMKDSIGLDEFTALLDWACIEQHFTERESRHDAWLLRDILLKHSADELCASYANFKLPALGEDSLSPTSNWADIGISLLIITNTFTTAAGNYPLTEMVFTLIYMVEIAARLVWKGPRDFFMGRDRAWHIFDFLVVFFSVLDEVLQRAVGNSSDVLIVRVARLLRLTRVMRVARLGVFEEFRMMILSIASGLRTLLWASLLLTMMIYLASSALQHTIGLDGVRVNDKYGTVMFQSLPWSGWAVFRMVMGDDTLADGTPLLMHLQALYGWSFVLPYAASYIIVVFGVFNTVTAIFVEKVIACSRARKQLSELERLLIVQKMRTLIICIGSIEAKEETSWSQRSLESRLLNMVPRNFVPVLELFLHAFPCLRKEDQLDETTTVPLEGFITHEQFTRAVKKPHVRELLVDLGVSVLDAEDIFKALDHDCSQTLDVKELVKGVLQLRHHHIEKTDIVATLLGVRSMHVEIVDLKQKIHDLAILCGAESTEESA